MNYAHRKSVEKGLLFESPLGDIVETTGESEHFDYCKILFRHEVKVVNVKFIKKTKPFLVDLDEYHLLSILDKILTTVAPPRMKIKELSMPAPGATGHFYFISLYELYQEKALRISGVKV